MQRYAFIFYFHRKISVNTLNARKNAAQAGKGSPYGSTYDGDIVSCTSVTPTRLTDGNCRDIITFFREQYSSECDQYWNYDKTWTWSGTIDGQQVKVSCPRLKWE